MILTVTNENHPPTITSQIPPLSFDENQTTFTLDLNTYFSDPDGDELTYTVGETEAVNATLQSKNVVIFSLANLPTTITNETILISATDPLGEKTT